MAKEIELWFLVKQVPDLGGLEALNIVQGYMPKAPAGPTVRVRVQNNEAFLTLKGKGTGAGIGVDEFEYAIPMADAREMMDSFCPRLRIEKTRYRIPHGELTIELDIFHGPLQGMMKAEVELPAETTAFTPPDWFGKEVTGQFDYSNLGMALAASEVDGGSSVLD